MADRAAPGGWALPPDQIKGDRWLIGGELFAETGLQRVALRAMKAPGTAFADPPLGKDPQPAHKNNY